MKKVVINEMTLINFKGHKNLTVRFGEKTTISGDNGAGKSIIFDAFLWLLFGKDQFERKDYEIIPTIDEKMLEKVDPEVSAKLLVDGTEVKLKRVLHQKWQRPRGQNTEVYTGNETHYYINDIPDKKASEYKAFVDSIIDENVFKLITNPSYFLYSKNMSWEKQREFLFTLAGTVNDHQIAASSPRFAALLEMISGQNMADFKKSIMVRKKKLKEELENIQPRIDQTTKLMPDNKDWATIKADLGKVEADLVSIDDEISGRTASIRERYEETKETLGKINNLKTKQIEIEGSATQKAQQMAIEANLERDGLNSQIAQSDIKLRGYAEEIQKDEKILEKKRGEAKKLEDEINQLRELWLVENKKEYLVKSGCLTCPLTGAGCNDANALEKHKEDINIAKSKFDEAKENALADINKQGKDKVQELSYCNTSIEDIESKINNQKQKQAIEVEHNQNLNKTLSAFPVVEPEKVFVTEINEWKQLQSEIDTLEASLQKEETTDQGALNEKKAVLISKRDEIKKILGDKELIEKYKEEVKNLENQGSNLAQQIADLEKTEFTINDFNKVKIEELDKRINGMFSIVKFKLFDKTNEGNEFECCIPCNKSGVPIAATNTAERINAGLDIINVLTKFYNRIAPVFLDNTESISNPLPLGGQVIYLLKEKGKSLTITSN